MMYVFLVGSGAVPFVLSVACISAGIYHDVEYSGNVNHCSASLIAGSSTNRIVPSLLDPLDIRGGEARPQHCLYIYPDVERRRFVR